MGDCHIYTSSIWSNSVTQDCEREQKREQKREQRRAQKKERDLRLIEAYDRADLPWQNGVE